MNCCDGDFEGFNKLAWQVLVEHKSYNEVDWAAGNKSSWKLITSLIKLSSVHRDSLYNV